VIKPGTTVNQSFVFVIRNQRWKNVDQARACRPSSAMPDRLRPIGCMDPVKRSTDGSERSVADQRIVQLNRGGRRRIHPFRRPTGSEPGCATGRHRHRLHECRCRPTPHR
jgi:hypothetical protein